jgi:uncharacterized membrane protein
MKIVISYFFAALFLMICVVLFALATYAAGATIGYTFTTVDIPLANGKTTWPEDINDTGALVANSWQDQAGILALPVTIKRVRTYNPTPFDCNNETGAETAAFTINSTAQVAGYCAGVSSNPTKLYGFIRNKNGKQTLIDYPGSDGTAVFGLNDRGEATGQFYGPVNQNRGTMSYRFHCFKWVKGKFTQIDFPRPNTYVTCNAINNKGQVLGEYITVTDLNEYVENGWFIYDNGNFQTDFPLSLAHIGGPAHYLIDMNNDGQIIGQRGDGSVFLWDDGIFYGVEFPADYHYPDVRGLNNRGQFVGLYHKEVGVDHYGYPRYETHGFLATPTR